MTVMWPTLISIGPLAIQSFGALIALGVFFGGFVLWYKAREEGFDEEAVMDSWLVSGLAGVVGGRLGYVLTHWQDFGLNWYKILFLTKFPGLAYEGVWLGAGLALLVFSLRKKWKVWEYLEIVVFGYLAVEVFGWLGSFLAGSSLGRPTDWWWGIGFPGVEQRRHPVQLLFLILMVILWLVLKKWEKQYRSFSWYQQKKGESQVGFVLAVYLIGLGAMRWGLGFLTEGLNQKFGLVLVGLGVLILLMRSGITVELFRRPTKVKVKPMAKKPEKKLRKKKGFDFK